jgi:transposase-like protein
MQTAEKRRRRRYTPAFKAAAIASGSKPGASVAAVALELHVNANMLRRWIKQSRVAEPKRVEAVRPARLLGPSPGFLPVALTDHVRLGSTPTTTPSPSLTERAIRVRIRKGSSRITIEWPTSVADACAAWLRELIA